MFLLKHRPQRAAYDHASCSNENLAGPPVSRLTLLFFGATKDVPEAAKMVAAGTACLDATHYMPRQCSEPLACFGAHATY
jgi:hypothetical protein